MIRFLLVLLAFVSALLAFIFQETALFVASGLLLLVSVVLLLLQVREQYRRKNRLKLPTELTPEDELKARGVLDVRPMASSKTSTEPAAEDTSLDEVPQLEVNDHAPEPIRASGVSEQELRAHGIVEIREKGADQQALFADEDSLEPVADRATETSDETTDESVEDTLSEDIFIPVNLPEVGPRRRVEVDAHLPVLQGTLGAHTVCLIDVDTDSYVYRLRSIVSNGAVDNAGTEYPFAGFFLSDLLAETSVLDFGGDTGLDIKTMGVIRTRNGLKQLVAAPVICDGLPAAFFVAAFETAADEACTEAVASAAEFFSSLYALQGDEPTAADSPLASAKRKPQPLRLVKSNPRSAQRKIIAEEISRARGKSRPLALALVCLDSGEEIAGSDETTIHEVEAWMRDCLEAVTPDGRVEYFGQLGYGILQTRDVTDVEGWVRRAQSVFMRQDGPVAALPVVGVAMLSEQHQGPDDLQADAFKALRAAYECGDSTILVG
jgi:hypothetical protein